MYIYLAEALKIFEKKELASFVKRIGQSLDEKRKGKEIVNDCLTWEMVERKAVVIIEARVDLFSQVT